MLEHFHARDHVERRWHVLGKRLDARFAIVDSDTAFVQMQPRNLEHRRREIDRDVLAVQPFIFAEMLVTRGKGELSGVAIKGIDPKLVKGVLDIEKHMIEGSVDTLNNMPADGVPPIIMGKELAHKLKAKVGDVVTVVVPLSNIDFDTFRAKS